MSTPDSLRRPVLFFDGECNLCNGVIQFILRNDKKKLFLFAPLSSQAAQRLPPDQQRVSRNTPDSIVLYSGGRYYHRSSAALHTARLLGGIWKVFYTAIIIPRFIRDAVYNVIARNRYRWFGRRECMVPGPGINDRFLK